MEEIDREEEVATSSTKSREGLPEEVILEQRPEGKSWGERILDRESGAKAGMFWGNS